MGQKDPANYAKFGDSKVPLDPEHKDLSIKCGQFLSDYFNKTATKEWPLVWTSQFLRAQQTWTGIKQGIGDHFNKEATWHIDTLLNEQSFGFLAFIENVKAYPDSKVAEIMKRFSEQMYKIDPYSNETLMGESPRTVVHNVRSFMDGPMARDVAEGVDDIMIISHGNVMKAFLMHWFHLYGLDSWKDMPPPENCDVYVIEGESKNWRVNKIYDGKNAISLLDNPINPIAHIKRPNEMPSPPLP